MSMFFVPLVTISLDGIPPDRIPLASGMSNFARITSGSFAASLITTFWDRRESLHQEQLVDGTSPFQRTGRADNDIGRSQGRAAAFNGIVRQLRRTGALGRVIDVLPAAEP